MCGIAGIHLRKPANLGHVNFSAVSKELLFAIDERGGDACGYVAVGEDGLLQEQKAACPALDFENEMRPMPSDMRTLLLHTRLATQGLAAFPENNHPVRSGPIRVIHNGVIYNDDDVFAAMPFARVGRVDSEAIAAVIRHYGWENATDALEQLEGSFAIAAINEEKPGELLLAKGDWSPMVVAVRPSFVMWASTEKALKYTWKACIGTTPEWKNLDNLRAGQFIRIKGSEVERGEFKAYRKPYRSTTYSYKATDDDTEFDSWFSDAKDRATGKIVYYKDGQRFEYDCATQTETCTGDYCDPRTHPLRNWVQGLTTRGTNLLGTGGVKFCAQCGGVEDDDYPLTHYGTALYCDDCADELTSIAMWDDADVYQREQADRERTQPQPVPENETDPNKFAQCPDCFDYFIITDMVKDSNEMVCKTCADIAGEMGNYGVTWRRNR